MSQDSTLMVIFQQHFSIKVAIWAVYYHNYQFLSKTGNVFKQFLNLHYISGKGSVSWNNKCRDLFCYGNGNILIIGDYISEQEIDMEVLTNMNASTFPTHIAKMVFYELLHWTFIIPGSFLTEYFQLEGEILAKKYEGNGILSHES